MLDMPLDGMREFMSVKWKELLEHGGGALLRPLLLLYFSVGPPGQRSWQINLSFLFVKLVIWPKNIVFK